MGTHFTAPRPPLMRGIKWIVLINVLFFLVELSWAYAVDFHPTRMQTALNWVSLSSDGVFSGRVWQPLTYMWFHDPNAISHILFNLLVLFWFGRDLEYAIGTRRFVRNFIIYGLGGALLIFLVSWIWLPVFGSARAGAIGASGAVAGIVAIYCFENWRSRLQFIVFQFSGRTLLLIFIGLDFFRLLLGEPIAVEGHWGGMLAAAALYYSDDLSPKVLSLRLKRWRLKRRLKLKRGGKGGKGNGEYLH